MLVLSRKLHEKIVLIDEETGKKVDIAVVGINNYKVKIGITAPKDVKVLREELISDS